MRQYVGARYVPIVDGEWVNSKTYEALTIVTYMGDSYTSKKPVPAGTLPTDTEYWVMTGAFNSQVNYLTGVVGDENSGLVHAVNGLEKKVLWTLQEMSEKTVILIGDSWGNSGGQRTNNWIDLITPYFAKVYRTAADGYSFNTSGSSFVDLLNAVAIDPDDTIDAIIAIGGANNIAIGDVTAFITAAKTAYPDAQVIVGANGPAVPGSLCWFIEQEIGVEAAKAGCTYFKDLWLTTAKSPISNWTSEFFHLRNSSEFVENLVSYLTTGEYCHLYYRKESPSLDHTDDDALGEYFKDLSYTAYNCVDNDFTFQFALTKGANFNAASDSISVTAGTFYKVGKFEQSFLAPFYNNSRMNNSPNYYAYMVFGTTNYDVYLHGIPDKPFCELLVQAKVTGTYTKAQFFTEARPAEFYVKGRFFDFSGLSAASTDIMLALTNNQTLGI